MLSNLQNFSKINDILGIEFIAQLTLNKYRDNEFWHFSDTYLLHNCLESVTQKVLMQGNRIVLEAGASNGSSYNSLMIGSL